MLAVYTRALLQKCRRRDRRQGIARGRTGTLTVIQRFGSGLNLKCADVDGIEIDGYTLTA